jgi:hypothetical protein
MSKSKYHSSLISSLHHLGRIDMWKRYGSGYAESKTIGNYKVEYDDDEEDLRMFIWSKERPCVVIVSSKSTNIAVLDGIYYYPDCTIDGKMTRGDGTREMVRFALNLIKETGAKYVELTDKSIVMCNGKKIKLGLMYFFKYGYTWYEYYFGFQPTQYIEEYKHAKMIQKTLGLHDKPCDYFTDTVLNDLKCISGFTFLTDIAWRKKL